MVLTTDPNRIPMKNRNTCLACRSPSDALETLEAAGCKHAYIDGGKTIQAFLRAGLLDEMMITTIPLLLGEGIRLFGSVNRDIKLKHLETKTYKNGFVQTRYAVADKPE